MLAQLLRLRAATIGRIVVIALVLGGISRAGWSALAQSETSNILVVIAQGLVVPPESAATWRVREIEPLSSDEAESAALDFSFAYAIEGATVIRNDVTGKRARIEDGEAYYFSAGDDYTRFRYGDDTARLLLIEFVTDSEESQPLGVHFESDTIESFPTGVYDYELVQGVLAKGGKVALPSHDGPALIYVLQGSLSVAPAGGKAATVDAESGTIVDGDANLTAGTDGALFLVASFNGRVLDPGETPESTEETSASTPAATEEEPTEEVTADATPVATATPEKPLAPSADEDRDGLLNGDETKAKTDPRAADTDGDGIKDGDEIKRYKTDPLERDTDGDGLDDGDEVSSTKTNPTKTDTDGDGTSDGDEWFIYGTDPTDKNDHP